METDMAYAYFDTALKKWLSEEGNTQKMLSLGSGYKKSYISQLLDDKRTKPIGFEAQTKIALACGCDYLTFLQMGKRILEGESAPFVNISPIKKAHHEIIDQFEDPETAKRFNENLIILEKYAKKSYERLYKESGDLAAAVKEAVGESQNLSRNGTTGGNQ